MEPLHLYKQKLYGSIWDLENAQFSNLEEKKSLLECSTFVSLWREKGFPYGAAGKESCSVGDLGSVPGLGRSPGEGNTYPLQYSGLENSMDCMSVGSQRVGHDRATFTFKGRRDTTVREEHLWRIIGSWGKGLKLFEMRSLSFRESNLCSFTTWDIKARIVEEVLQFNYKFLCKCLCKEVSLQWL